MPELVEIIARTLLIIFGWLCVLMLAVAALDWLFVRIGILDKPGNEDELHG